MTDPDTLRPGAAALVTGASDGIGRAVAERLLERRLSVICTVRRRGHVVTLGSIAGLRSIPGIAVYGATKFAVRAFTEALRQDYDTESIRITEILPGLVRTGFAAARFRGDVAQAEAFYDSFPAALEAEDIAAAVIFALAQPQRVNVAQIVVTPTGDK